MSTDDSNVKENPATSYDWSAKAGPIFKYGLAVGFALIVLGAVCMRYGITTYLLASLLVCAGLGIILGAFGAVAIIKVPVQGATVMGVGALVVTLFLLLNKDVVDPYVKVTIGGDIIESQVDFIGERSYLGAFQKTERFYRFIVFSKELSQSVLSVFITTADKHEFPFECVKPDFISSHMATGGTIAWKFNKERGELVNADDGSLVATVGSCRQLADASPLQTVDSLGSVWLPELISSARAQGSGSSTTYIQQLASDSSYVRRNSRTMLAQQGVTGVPAILEKLRSSSQEYRVRLGLVVALTEMMREHKDQREQIASKISLGDLGLLVDAAIDDDRTIRVYASEFLYDLGDPRIVDEVKRKFPKAGDDGRYNLLLTLKGAVPYLNVPQKTSVAKYAASLKPEVGPETNKLADSLIQQAGGATLKK
jgi:hypothetical protein